jgi:hypothetical protein
MRDRRTATRLVVSAAVMAACAWLLPPSAAHAQQSFQRFIPLLIDLPGWKADKPDGMSMEMPGNSMVTATRTYARGEAHLDAQIISGPVAQGTLAMATEAGMKIETSEGRMSTSTIDGLRVVTTFTVSDKSGAILVALGPSALFTLSFTGVAEDEALALAKKFNWKAMQAAMPK